MLCYLKPGSLLTRLHAGVVAGLLTIQYIYQLHGLLEMHFWYFILSTLLIAYADWRVFTIGVGLIVVQHTYSAILHNSGTQTFFWEDDKVELSRLVFHYGLVVLHLVLVMVASILYRKNMLADIAQADTLRSLNSEMQEKHQEMASLTEELRQSNDAMAAQQAELELLNAELEQKVNDRLKDMQAALAEAQQEKARSEALAKELGEKQRIEESRARLAQQVQLGQNEQLQAWGDRMAQTVAKEVHALQIAIYAVDIMDIQITHETLPKKQLVGAFALENPQARYGKPIELIGPEIEVVRRAERIRFSNLANQQNAGPASLLTLPVRDLLYLPLVADGKCVGFMELGTAKQWSAQDLSYLQHAAELLAGQLLVAVNNRQIENLLWQSQAKNSELEMREEELRQNLQQLEAIQQEMRQAQEQLQHMNENLEHIVEDRTRELKSAVDELQSTQQQLVISEKMAALGQLVANVAHEMNTPLGAIKASAENITDILERLAVEGARLTHELSPEHITHIETFTQTLLSEKQVLSMREERQLRKQMAQQLIDAGVTEDIAQEAARQWVDAGMYQDVAAYVPLLQLPQAEAIIQYLYAQGQVIKNVKNIHTASDKTKRVVFALKSYAHSSDTNERVPTNLKDHIETVLTIYHNQLKYGVEVNTQYEDIPEVPTYADELSQVWTNILQNAIQAMKGQGNLDIRAVDEGDTVAVHITDSGPGIPKEIQEKIFQPFFTTKQRGEGTGLGLDICRKIVEKHNGQLLLDSVPGRTTFTVRLPKVPQEGVTTATEASLATA
jgi:signal transduction histidine kinase